MCARLRNIRCSVVTAAVTDTTGYILHPKTNALVEVAQAPPGAVAIDAQPDSLGNPVVDAFVRWSIAPDNLGSITASSTSDLNGVASTVLTYHERFVGQSVSVTVRTGSAIRVDTFALPPPP